MSDHTNIVRIKAVNQALAGLLGQNFVFVGGAVSSLYADRETREIRPTDDVDVLVEIYTRMAFAQLEEHLRSLGFKNDTSAKFVGRFLMDNLIVDFMPLEEKILGFNNKWYLEGFKNSILIILDERNTVNIFKAPFFLAAKFEAFKSRGKNDGRVSTDFEDIVYVLNNRSSIWQEMAESESVLREYLKTEFADLLANRNVEEWLNAHISFSAGAANTYLLPNIRKFVTD
ncbi:hypothetical protein [Dinghuibacter silviterrae]|uniref:hypothetical protein n=1 Tax=Dinghuibacter silviterrae TaxID=1539049 RepID=UPI0010642BF5|nr:hypothetical protein [Dinghuibacter silviterrae]